MSICGYFFFFKQKTAYEMRISDWSSDVCSSDLQWGQARNQSSEGRVAEQAGEIKATLIKRRERRQLAQGRSAEAAAYIEVREDFEHRPWTKCRAQQLNQRCLNRKAAARAAVIGAMAA